jgi:hypothetical protein
VAEIGLDGASVVAVVGELEPAGMPQHVRMHEEREFRSTSGASLTLPIETASVFRPLLKNPR